MEITIDPKVTTYLTKKYGDATGIIQQVVDNWIDREVGRDYEKTIKVDTSKKIDELNKK